MTSSFFREFMSMFTALHHSFRLGSWNHTRNHDCFANSIEPIELYLFALLGKRMKATDAAGVM